MRNAAKVSTMDDLVDEESPSTSPKVVSFPTLREIPEASIPFGKAGMLEYEKLTRMLYDAGRLTELTIRSIEVVALAKDAIAKIYARKNGGVPSASIMTQMNVALRTLRLADVDRTVNPAQKSDSKFGRSGFAARRRSTS